MSEKTASENLTRFKPGQSGNPNGRPKGTKHKLSEDFLKALSTDFQEHGANVIESVRIEKPSDYLKIVSYLVPKELHLKVDPFEEMTDAQLINRARELGRGLRVFGVGSDPIDVEKATGPEPVGEVPPVH